MSTYNQDGATITITPTTSTTSTEQTGAVSFSGKVRRGRPIVLGSVVVTADSGKYFSSPPRLVTKSKNLSAKFRNRVSAKLAIGDGTFYTSYTYDLIFVARTSTVDSGLDVRFRYSTKTIPTITYNIKNIIFGSNNIAESGETRRIKVVGDRKAKFALAINENYEETITLDDGDATTGNETISNFHKRNDRSIIRSSVRNRVEYNYGKKINILRGQIGQTGVYEFDQVFPSVTSNRTRVNGTVSGAAKVIFDDLNNVRVGDRIYATQIADATVVKVLNLDPDGDNRDECTLDTDVTLTDDSIVMFKRSKVYSIDIIPDLTSTLGPRIPTTDPEYRLYQYMDPVLTLTHKPESTAGFETKVTKYNDVNTELAHSVSHTVSHTGKANALSDRKNRNITNRFSVKLEVTCHQADHRFTARKLPIFSNKIRPISPTTASGAANTNAVVSNWTNSISEFNGGTVINITNIRIAALTFVTVNLFYDVEIVKWGNKDVNMELDLAAILTNT